MNEISSENWHDAQNIFSSKFLFISDLFFDSCFLVAKLSFSEIWFEVSFNCVFVLFGGVRVYVDEFELHLKLNVSSVRALSSFQFSALSTRILAFFRFVSHIKYRMHNEQELCKIVQFLLELFSCWLLSCCCYWLVNCWCWCCCCCFYLQILLFDMLFYRIEPTKYVLAERLHTDLCNYFHQQLNSILVSVCQSISMVWYGRLRAVSGYINTNFSV